MKKLNIFIDESGDFGHYNHHSPYYIITMVFHDQNHVIDQQINKLEQELTWLGYKDHCIHSGPIIRQEKEYQYCDIGTRRRLLIKFLSFIRQIDIKYHCIYIEKRQLTDSDNYFQALTKHISHFISTHYSYFLTYDQIHIYYDNGQTELSKILSSVFHTLLPSCTFHKVLPSGHRLFQVADLICTFELIRLKLEHHSLSKSELLFFGTPRDLKKNYLKPLQNKNFYPS